MQRLDRLISSQTGLSRKDVKGLIKRGAIVVDGVVARFPDIKVDPVSQTVLLDGKGICYKPFLYIMLNKPLGVVCSTEDGDKTVIDILPEELKRPGLFPAGRLDKYSRGFVLITDDGALGHAIISPKSHLPKVYKVQTDKPIPESLIEQFKNGVDIGQGSLTLPATLEISGCDARVTITQGLYHQIRRMFDAFDIKVVDLKRFSIGPVELDPALVEGQSRELSPSELSSIKDALDKNKSRI